MDELIFLNKKKLVLPFLTLQQVYHNLDQSKLPAIKLLHSVENTLSSDENEALTLSVMVFRLWGLYCKSISDKKVTEGQRGKCRLSELVPLEGRSDKYIEFEPKFVVHSTPYRVDKDHWNQFFNDYSKEFKERCIAFHNLPNASFSDGIMMTNPPIFIQDKQEVISRKKEMIGCSSPNILGKGVVKSEHKKVLDANVGEHIFIFITDAHARDDESYDCNEIVITSENREDFYGDILAKMKLYCIGRS